MAAALLQFPTPTGCVALPRTCVTPKNGVFGVAFSDRMCITSGGKGQQELNRPWRVTERGAREVVGRRSAKTASGSSVDVATADGVTEVDKDTFWPFVEEAGEKVLVLDMYTQWCGPCTLMSPKLMEDDVEIKTLEVEGAVITEPIVVQEGKRAVKFRPCIDIHKGKVKQIVGSTLRDLPDDQNSETAVSLVTNFESQISAGEFAEMYKKDGLHGGHIIMLGADPASHAAALEALRAYPGGLQVGGGVNLDNARGYLDAGASHVIVTSFVFRDGKMDEERLKQLVKLTGKSRLVLDLSCRKKDGQYLVVTDRWQRFSDLVVNEATLAMLSASADEFLVHGVDVEGKRLGIDDELVSILGRHSPIPVTYAGGVNTLADLERIKAAGKGVVDVTVGSALDVFGGDLPYAEVVAWHKRQLH